MGNDLISFHLHFNPISRADHQFSYMPTSRSTVFFLALLVFGLPARAQNGSEATHIEAAPLDSIRNWMPISDVLFTGGQVANEQAPLLAEKGVQTVINLATPRQDLNGEEGFHIASAGMTYVNIPVEWQNPTLDDVDQFFRVMKANEGRSVFVHCVANYRGSAFTFLYRVLVEGVPEDEARRDMESIWDPVEYDAWNELINDALKSPRFKQ
jgi:protein tyrosine phosphatase (PTP) superfamily phosphohydrolase (DUF442 family)